MHGVSAQKIKLLVKSFGFKYGLPPDVDFVFDVRCLPNPYWEPTLKALSGLNAPVIQYLEQIPAVQHLLKDIAAFISTWVPYFEADDRAQLTIAIGCTGGQHRSVYIVETLAKKLRENKIDVQIQHQNLSVLF
jgi:UPF0042 nucleotide-binding protein